MNELLEHFHEAVNTPEDVEKIKKYILQLAMQGKLVEQDPNDEPASELLKRIQAEKERLIKEKKIKRQKDLPPVDESEIPYELPHGWEWVRLGFIGDWGAGATPKRGNSEFYNGSIPWLKTGELNDGIINQSEEYVTELALQKTSLRLNKPGDVLIAMYGATIGKLGILEIEATTNQACCACTPFNGVYNKFLFFFLLSQRDYYKSQGAGGAQPNISKEKIINSIFPLPPLKQQKRIVNKLEELFKQCDQLSSELLKKEKTSVLLNKSVFGKIQDHGNPNQLDDLRFAIENMEHLCNDKIGIDLLRSSVLSLAVQGKLVEQDTSNEPAVELIKRIQSEKRRLVAEKKINKEKPLPMITPEEVPYDIPIGWKWVRLGEVIELISGQHITSSDYNSAKDGIPYLTGPSDFDGEGVSFTRWTKNPKVIAFKNDLLVTVKGSGVGKMAVLDKADAAIGRQLMAIRSIGVDIDYIKILIKLLAKRLKEMSVGIAIPGISREDILYLLIPLPPLREQKMIVQKVDDFFDIIKQIEQSVESKQSRSQQLLDVFVNKDRYK